MWSVVKCNGRLRLKVVRRVPRPVGGPTGWGEPLCLSVNGQCVEGGGVVSLGARSADGRKWCCGGGGCGGDVAAGVMMLSGSMVGCGMGWHGGGREWGELAGGRPKSRRKMGDGVRMLEKEERKISVCVSGYK
ncbi:hypothetical protein Tco_0488816 [Tanacetum coccineum]